MQPMGDAEAAALKRTGRPNRLVADIRLCPLDAARPRPYVPRHLFQGSPKGRQRVMKVVNSLKSMKDRHKECRIIRRKGRLYVINKRNPRFKARQG